MQSRWSIAAPASPEMRAHFPELHPVVVQMLASRGITTQEEVDEFMLPDYGQDLHDPFLFRHMEQACERVWRALKNGEKIVIHGDYDADGISGSTVLMATFRDAARRLGANVENLSAYLPHREKEGYGIRVATVEKLAASGHTLMITVDCGISCGPEIARATELGMDTIVVDHHQIPEKIPECTILHPLVDGETYPFKKLAAVGVAFKFACGFVQYAERMGSPFEVGFEKWLLDLVSIATVTDFVPLVGENRTLERYGLVVLNKTKRIGLRKLIESAGLEFGKLDTISVGFYIGPRINAASRMEHAELAFKCLAAETEEDAAMYAERLNQANKDRQKYTEQIMAAAKAEVARMGEKKIYMVCGDGWSAGIVGLVAGKLVNELGRPVFVFGREMEDGKAKMVGSGRSIDGFNVVSCMEQASQFLLRFGGHPQACGLTIETDENYAAFVASAEAYAEEVLAGRDLRPVVPVEAEIRVSQISWELIAALDAFEPFGEGNPRPKFLLRDLLVSEVTLIGKTKQTVRITARGDVPREKKLIAFNFASRVEGFTPGMTIDVVVELGVNEWNGTKEIQLRMLDLAKSGEAIIEQRVEAVAAASKERAPAFAA